MVTTSLDGGISLRNDILQNGNHLVLRFKHPRIGAEVRLFPLCHHLVVGNQVTHHTLMADVRQRGIEVDEVTADVVQVMQAVSIGKYTLDDFVAQRLVESELVAVLLPAGLHLRELALQRILIVRWHYPIEGLAGRLFANLNLRIALRQFLTERRHTEHATTCE